jgi:hypothetical protein
MSNNNIESIETFLNYDNFIQLVANVNQQINELHKLPKDKRIRQIKQLLKFDKLFVTDTVQGVAGIVKVNCGTPEPIPVVFKISCNINRTVEHEHAVLLKLNSIRSCCPNFVGTLGLLSAYVSKNFFESEYEDTFMPITADLNLFDAKASPIPANYLLMEYVGDISFRKMCKYSDKNTITSTLMSVMCALQIAQKFLNFTHYDLHIGNIIMRPVEPDSYFAYIVDNDIVAFPTYGWYPVIIDMGTSYVDGLEDRPTRCTVHHYHHGQMSTEHDRLGDIHHFLLNAISELEENEDQSSQFNRHFRWLSTRIMLFFRQMKVWRAKGWKQLPCNLYSMFNNCIYQTKPVLCEFYSSYRSRIVDIFTLGVKLPWQNVDEAQLEQLVHYFDYTMDEVKVDDDVKMSEQSSSPIKIELSVSESSLLRQSMEDICHFINILDFDIITKSDIDILYCLRALIEHASLIHLDWNSISTTKFDIPKDIINSFKQVTNVIYSQLSYKLDLKRCFRGAHCIGILLRHLFYSFNTANISVASEWSNQVQHQLPFYYAKFLQRNCCVRQHFEGKTPLYIFDADNKRSIHTTFGALNIDSNTSDWKQQILNNRVQI